MINRRGILRKERSRLMPAFFFGGWRNHSSLDGEQLKKGARHGSMVVDGWLHSCICMRDRYSVLTVGYGHLACCCHHCLRMLVVSPGSFPAFLFLIISSLTSSILDLKPCKIYIYYDDLYSDGRRRGCNQQRIEGAW
jgi:hypothetical protein